MEWSDLTFFRKWLHLGKNCERSITLYIEKLLETLDKQDIYSVFYL